MIGAILTNSKDREKGRSHTKTVVKQTKDKKNVNDDNDSSQIQKEKKVYFCANFLCLKFEKHIKSHKKVKNNYTFQDLKFLEYNRACIQS